MSRRYILQAIEATGHQDLILTTMFMWFGDIERHGAQKHLL